MQTHPDYDSPNFQRFIDMFESEKTAAELTLEAMKLKAERMMEAGESQITAGAPGEEVVDEDTTPHCHVKQLPDDPLALRISIGEGRGIPESRYLVFRGDPQEVVDLLDRAMRGLQVFMHRSKKRQRR